VLASNPSLTLKTDVTDETITLSDSSLVFKGKSSGQDYTCDLSFFKDLDSSASTYKVGPRSIQMYLVKKEKEEEFWPRLLEDKVKEKGQVKIDWDKYVDEDEEDEAEAFDTDGMDGSMMGGGGGMPPGMDMEALMKQMGGMGGMGGADGGMAEMMAKMKGDLEGGAGGPAPGGGDDDEPDSDDDDLPDLEES